MKKRTYQNLKWKLQVLVCSFLPLKHIVNFTKQFTGDKVMKSFFCFPPNWCNSHPYMSIPVIIPYLKDFDVEVCDLNIQYRIYQRSKENLDKCHAKINEFVSKKLEKKYDI